MAIITVIDPELVSKVARSWRARRMGYSWEEMDTNMKLHEAIEEGGSPLDFARSARRDMERHMAST